MPVARRAVFLGNIGDEEHPDHLLNKANHQARGDHDRQNAPIAQFLNEPPCLTPGNPPKNAPQEILRAPGPKFDKDFRGVTGSVHVQ